MRQHRYSVGKLPMSVLADLIERYARPDPRVVLGPRIGEDSAVIDMGDRYLVAKTDPISFATDQIGWYAVHVNANDLACSAARPRWFMATVLLPEAGTDRALVDSIFRQMDDALRPLGAVLMGGHTEVTYDLTRPIVVGHMLGEVAKDRLVTTAGARPGDSILLTKSLAIEGTALIAREKRADLLAHGFTDEDIRQAQDLLYTPGISVVREALLAADTAPIHSMHDTTEGGLVTGLHELARAAGVGLVIDSNAVPVLPICRRICEYYKIHPLGLLASGSLLICTAPDDEGRVGSALRQAGIACTCIGHVMSSDYGCRIQVGGQLRDLPIHERDEVTKIL